MNDRPLTEQQQRILDYCFDAISNDGAPVSSLMISEALSMRQYNIATKLYALSHRELIELKRDTGSNGGGSAWVVHAVRHPIFGSVECEATDLDESSGLFMFKRDLPERDLVTRNCLTCQTEFVADGRFLRLCPDCRAEATDAASEATGGYWSNAQAILTGQVGGYERPDRVAIRRILGRSR